MAKRIIHEESREDMSNDSSKHDSARVKKRKKSNMKNLGSDGMDTSMNAYRRKTSEHSTKFEASANKKDNALHIPLSNSVLVNEENAVTSQDGSSKHDKLSKERPSKLNQSTTQQKLPTVIPVYQITSENESFINGEKKALWFKVRRFSSITLYLQNLDFSLDDIA